MPRPGVEHRTVLPVVQMRDGSWPRLLQGRYSLVGDRAKGDRIMTEASSGAGGTRPEIERAIVRRSLEDEEFRQRLLDDPKGTLEQEIGRGLPEGVQVRVVEESADTIYLVLPSASAVGEGGGSLSDEALEAVSGGGPALTSVLGVFTCGGACGN
jgi:Nitrile hydratase, alpha chain